MRCAKHPENTGRGCSWEGLARLGWLWTHYAQWAFQLLFQIAGPDLIMMQTCCWSSSSLLHSPSSACPHGWWNFWQGAHAVYQVSCREAELVSQWIPCSPALKGSLLRGRRLIKNNLPDKNGILGYGSAWVCCAALSLFLTFVCLILTFVCLFLKEGLGV